MVYMFDEMLVINSAFGRELDAQKVTAFSVLVDDDAQEVAIKMYKNGEEKSLRADVQDQLGIYALRPNGPTRNAGRRVNIRVVQNGRGWLKKDMICENEAQRRRYPVFDTREDVFVLKHASDADI